MSSVVVLAGCTSRSKKAVAPKTEQVVTEQPAQPMVETVVVETTTIVEPAAQEVDIETERVSGVEQDRVSGTAQEDVQNWTAEELK